MARDFLGEMSERISAALATQSQPSRSVFAAHDPGRTEPPNPPVLIARDLVRQLRTEDPALLAGWLDRQAVETLSRHIDRRQPAAVRTARRRVSNADKFAAVLEAKLAARAQQVEAAS